jgi:hypothetical protein
MISIELKGKIHNLITNGNEVNIIKGMMAQPFIKDKDEINWVDKATVLSIFSDSSAMDWAKGNEDVINALYDKLPVIKGDSNIIDTLTFKVKGNLYGIRKLEDMNLLEFIDLSIALNDVDNNIGDLINILFRPVVKHTGYKTLNILSKFKSVKTCGYKPYFAKTYEVEDYNPYNQTNSNLSIYVSYLYFQKILLYIISDLEQVINNYKVIYKNEDEAHELNKKARPELYEDDDKEIIHESNPLSIYGIYNSLANICNDDKQAIDYWLEKPYIEFLEFYTYILLKQNKK